jgi:phosphoribosylformylglycinamidine cyclo-ligase
MPGFYADGEYDIAGFIVGIVEKSRVIDGRSIVPGDSLIGLPSDGLHTNGYSLARKVLFDAAGLRHDAFVPEIGATVADALLAPHRSYLNAIRPLLERGLVKGMAHITGGGITENLPRVLPEGTAAAVNPGAWHTPPLFSFLQQRGGIAADEMMRAFNMGIGLIVVCAPDDTGPALDALQQSASSPVLIGRVTAGQRDVRYTDAP